MRHPTDGTLRRLVDEPAGVADADREHVASCPVCLSGLAAAQEDAALTGAALDVDVAAGRGRGVAPPRRSVGRRGRAARRGAGARAVPPLAGGAAQPGGRRGRGRRAAGRRPAPRPPRTGCRSSGPSGSPRSRSPRPTWSTCPTSRRTARSRSTEEPDVHEVADAAAAEEATGLTVPQVDELPRGRDGGPDLPGRRPGASAVFTFSAEKAAQTPRRSRRRRCRHRPRASTAASSG